MTATAGRDRAEGPRAALAAERARNATEDLRRARAENARIESAIRDERDGLARAREALTARAAALAAAQGTARANRMRMFQSALPDETRLQTLRLKHARERLAVERARAVQRLRLVFPIVAERVPVERNPEKHESSTSASSAEDEKPKTKTKNEDQKPKTKRIANSRHPVGAAHRPRPPTAVTVCGLRIPDPGDASPPNPREISAGLGMTLALVNLSASVLGAPSLHRGEFRGSESFIWTPRSFWEDEPEAAKPEGSAPGKLRLYLPEKVGGVDAGGEETRGGARSSVAREGGADDARGGLDGSGRSRHSPRDVVDGLTGALEGLNRGLDRVEAALQGVDGPGGRVAAAVGRVAGGIGTVAGGIGTGIGRVGAAVCETGERRAATNVSNKTASNPLPGRSTGLSTGLSTDARSFNGPNDPNKPHRAARPSPVHPPVPIHPAEWSKQAEREAAAARARAELNAGIRLLHRSAAAICADARSSSGARPPPPEDWGPLATLALTLAELARGAKKGGGFPDATAWVQRRRLNDADGGTVSKTVSSSGIAGRLGAWEMRESAFLAPAISRAAHSGLTGAQSLMSSVFGGRPAGRTGRAGRGGARSSGTIGEDDDDDDGIRSPDLEYSGDDADASSAMAESTWQLVDAPVGRDGVAAVSSRGRAAVLPPPPSKPEDVERWTRAMDLGGGRRAGG